MQSIVSSITDLFNTHKAQILAGGYAAFYGNYFEDFSVYEEERGKIVVTLNYKPSVLPGIEAHARHVDIFLLKAGQALGPHFHKEASAQIHFLSGKGEAFIADESIRFTTGTTTRFPAGVVHDVAADADGETAVFISLQDNPILKPDGTLDYFDVEPALS